MNIGRFGMLGALVAILALPAAAQTTQSTPTKPSTTLASPAAGTKPAPSSSSALTDINSASVADLDKLPGIGQTRAEAIVKGRPYNGKDDLLNRHILPSNVYNGIKGKIIAKQG